MKRLPVFGDLLPQCESSFDMRIEIEVLAKACSIYTIRQSSISSGTSVDALLWTFFYIQDSITKLHQRVAQPAVSRLPRKLKKIDPTAICSSVGGKGRVTVQYEPPTLWTQAQVGVQQQIHTPTSCHSKCSTVALTYGCRPSGLHTSSQIDFVHISARFCPFEKLHQLSSRSYWVSQ